MEMGQDSKGNPFSLKHIDLELLDPALSPPTKLIHSGEDLRFFLTSQAYYELKLWTLQLTRSCLPQTDSNGHLMVRRLDGEITYTPTTLAVRDMLTELEKLLDDTPPVAGPRRFGNAAFRSWFQKFEASIDTSMTVHLEPIAPRPIAASDIVMRELKSYLLGSFGSAQRLDYGTGHELSFLAFLGILWKAGYFTTGDEWSIVVGTLQP